MSSLFFTITLILVNPVAIMCHSPCLLTEFVIKKFSSTEDAAFVILLSGFRYGAVEPLVEAWDGLAFFFLPPLYNHLQFSVCVLHLCFDEFICFYDVFSNYTKLSAWFFDAFLRKIVPRLNGGSIVQVWGAGRVLD